MTSNLPLTETTTPLLQHPYQAITEVVRTLGWYSSGLRSLHAIRRLRSEYDNPRLFAALDYLRQANASSCSNQANKLRQDGGYRDSAGILRVVMVSTTAGYVSIRPTSHKTLLLARPRTLDKVPESVRRVFSRAEIEPFPTPTDSSKPKAKRTPDGRLIGRAASTPKPSPVVEDLTRRVIQFDNAGIQTGSRHASRTADARDLCNAVDRYLNKYGVDQLVSDGIRITREPTHLFGLDCGAPGSPDNRRVTRKLSQVTCPHCKAHKDFQVAKSLLQQFTW